MVLRSLSRAEDLTCFKLHVMRLVRGRPGKDRASRRCPAANRQGRRRYIDQIRSRQDDTSGCRKSPCGELAAGSVTLVGVLLKFLPAGYPDQLRWGLYPIQEP